MEQTAEPNCQLCGEPLPSRSQWRYHLMQYHQVLPNETTVVGRMVEPAGLLDEPEDGRGDGFISER